jgi:hypothetical protein
MGALSSAVAQDKTASLSSLSAVFKIHLPQDAASVCSAMCFWHWTGEIEKQIPQEEPGGLCIGGL